MQGIERVLRQETVGRLGDKKHRVVCERVERGDEREREKLGKKKSFVCKRVERGDDMGPTR